MTTFQYSYQGSGYLNDTGQGQFGGFGSVFGVFIAEVGGVLPPPPSTQKPWRRVLLDQEDDDNLSAELMFHPRVSGSPPAPVATPIAFRRFRFAEEEAGPEDALFLMQRSHNTSVNPPSRRFIRPYLSVNI